ncbi:MAG TPA: arginine N-succinyltransferase [Polyangiales bacterium]|nr:arginine N-succinyltransferase [Polyangiales bacterium]
MASRYEIRAASVEHLDDLSVLARHLNTVNLPDDPEAIRHLLETSERSFSGDIRDPRKREYVFVLWDREQQRAVGTSMIIAQLGRRGVPYIYLEVREEEKYSATLDRHYIHKVLTTRYSYDGPTELGGLVMHPESRRSPERLGSLISYVRFLFVALRRGDFCDQMLAELLPPFEPDGSSLLWEAYGRRFTGLSYREADRLSRSNKEFVRSLFPDEIYASLLSPEAQRVIGAVGAETQGVEKMLRRVGFEYAQRVDPFDGGPHFTCPTDRISLIAATKRCEPELRWQASLQGLVGLSYSQRPYFVATPCRLEPVGAGYAIPEATLSDLPTAHADGLPMWMPLG